MEFLETTGRKIRHSGAPYRARSATSASNTTRSISKPARSARSRERNARSDGMRIIDAGLPWRRLDALDQLRHLSLECVGWPKEVGPEGDKQIAVLTLDIQARTGEQS